LPVGTNIVLFDVCNNDLVDQLTYVVHDLCRSCRIVGFFVTFCFHSCYTSDISKLVLSNFLMQRTTKEFIPEAAPVDSIAATEIY